MENLYPCSTSLSWEHYPQVNNSSKGGEALLLSKLVALSTGTSVLSL
jgi:hypothetical protein